MYALTEKLRSLKPYDPIQGNYKIRLDANESCFEPDEIVKSAIMDRVSKIAFNRYPDPFAAEACAAFADYYGVKSEYVTAGNGSDELISIIVSSFLEKGDTVLTFSPDFSMYNFYSRLYELNVADMPKDGDMRIDIEKTIEYCAQNNIKAVIFSNPCNPTSVGITRGEVIRLIGALDCLVIVDEAYMDFWNQSVLDMAEQFDNLIVLKTFSKACGFAAVRLGFAVACERITNALRAAKSPYNTDSLSQAIGTAVFSQKDYLRTRVSALIESRDMLYTQISGFQQEYPELIGKIFPTRTNFVYFASGRAGEIYEKLLGKSIAVRYFGDSLRITCGTPAENAELISALRTILSDIRNNGKG